MKSCGISQRIEVLGKVFSVETEIDGSRLKAEIFLGGKLMAVRESRLGDERLNSGNIRADLVQYHQHVISEITERAERRAPNGHAPHDTNGQEGDAEAIVGPRSGGLNGLLQFPSRGNSTKTEPSNNARSTEGPKSRNATAPLGDVAGHKARPGGTIRRTATISLADLAAIDGFLGACLVDSESGMLLGAEGGGAINLDIAAAGNAEIVRAERQTMRSLGLEDQIEDILISLGQQYHLSRPLEVNGSIFLYLVLDRSEANLAAARRELHAFEASISKEVGLNWSLPQSAAGQSA